MAEASSPEELHPALADAAVTRLGVDAAAVLRVADNKLVLTASRNLPRELAGWSVDIENLDLVGRSLQAATGFADARVMMLVVGGDIFGTLVLLSQRPIHFDEEQLHLAEAIVDLAASAAERAESYASLAKSYAELKSSREVLARTERLRILGEMAAGISHDVKNILNPLGLQLEILRRKLARDDIAGASETVDRVAEVIRHGVDVVERLREFSRQAPEHAETVDVDRVVATAVELSRPRVSLNSKLELRVKTSAPPPIHARASELATAVVNLIVNATEAMPNGGTITVSTGTRDGGVWIAVADDGPGIPPEVERHVFDPFFTTKSEGTGLGLAMIYAFVTRFGGRVSVETAVGKGTTFTLWFPSA